MDLDLVEDQVSTGLLSEESVLFVYRSTQRTLYIP